MSLKELTKSQHQNAERQKFASVLMSGKIPKITYLRYLMNQLKCYQALENHPNFQLPDERLRRSEAIQQDIKELIDDVNVPISELKQNAITNSTLNYVIHVAEKIQSSNDFMAHVYVRYLGDLRGGQMIAKKIPGAGRYYNFEDPNALANSIYSNLNDDMANEAKNVFDFATHLFIEMHDVMLQKNEYSDN